MFEFVYWLKALAAVLITNSHYADIWPVSALAMGGHFGNCIYFLVSGFCLYNIKEPFYKWYPKRMVRIYPAVFIIMAVRLLFMGDTITTGFWGYVRSFIYPTWYHFVGSILLLYILFYTVRYFQNKFKIKMRYLFMALGILFAVIYIFFFDKSHYHIDNVEEKTVRFMFFASMLSGAYLRERYENISDKISPLHIVAVLFFGGAYLVLKILLRKNTAIVNYMQFVSPVICVLFIYGVALLFVKLEKKGVFKRASGLISKPVKWISGLTLEIYLWQFLVIGTFADKFSFPVNFIVVTVLIAIAAYIANILSRLIQKPFNKLLSPKT